MTSTPLEPFGPVYPDLGAGVAKHRRKAQAAGSVAAMERADRHAYADAIEKAIRAKQRTMHMRPTPPMTPGWYSPPSITRLLRYENPLPMVGDPPYSRDGDAWDNRQRAIMKKVEF